MPADKEFPIEIRDADYYPILITYASDGEKIPDSAGDQLNGAASISAPYFV